MDKLRILSTVKIESQEHPNKQPFKGILCSLDSASTKAPMGAEGKQVILTKAGAEKAIETLKGMPVNVVWDNPNGKFTGHEQTTVVGICANAWIQDNDVWIEGYLFPQNYPQICASVKQEKSDLGFSYEILASSYETKGNQMLVNEFTFIGTALLYKDSAAYGEDTQLIAATKDEKDDVEMTKEEFQGMIDAMLGNIDKKINDIKAGVEEKVLAIETKVEESVIAVKAEAEKANKQVEDLAVALAETKEIIKASADEPLVKPAAPEPTIMAANQTVIENNDFKKTKDDKEAKIKEINASTMSPLEKCKAITHLRFQA